jgi:PEP-CTERM motif
MKILAPATSALAGALALMGVLAIPGSAHATLHGFCDTLAPCSDNGTNTPTSVNPPDFGFSAGGHSATGDLMIDILVPDNVSNPMTTYTISGPLVGTSTFTATLFSTTPWTGAGHPPQALDSYLGLSASPNNPIGAYLPSAQTFQPSATGFYVYTADLGTQTLPSNSGASNFDLLTLNKGILQGSYVVAFLGGTNATANSGAILETGPMSGVPEPSTWAMLLLGFAGLGFAGYRKTRNARTALSAA